MVSNDAVASPMKNSVPPARKHIVVDEVQVAAAKLQITLDRKFGRKTPEIIKKIAAAK